MVVPACQFYVEAIGCIAFTAVTGVFLIATLVVLSYQSSMTVQLMVVSVRILKFSFLVSLFSMVSHRDDNRGRCEFVSLVSSRFNWTKYAHIG